MARTKPGKTTITLLLAVLAVVAGQDRFQQQQRGTGGSEFNRQQASSTSTGHQQQQQQQQQQGTTGTRNDADVCFPFAFPDRNFPQYVEDFSYRLFKALVAQSGETSVIVSPYSIWSVLTLAYFGANGGTAREIENALNYFNKTQTLANWRTLRFIMENGSGSAELAIANRGYFTDRLTLNSCLTSNLFDMRHVDFTRGDAVQLINNDVSETTRGYIPQLITFLPPQTRMALVNAVFFKGEWANQFDPELTRVQEFLVPPGVSSGRVMMMNREGDIVAGQAQGLDAIMVELPYLSSNISMFLLLPNNPMAPLSQLLSRLNPQTFASAVHSLPPLPLRVSLSLPRFKLTTRFEKELIAALGQVGVTSLFDPARADLSGFAHASPPLAVDTAITQAVVEVNEEGTVAAAATAFVDTRFGQQQSLEVVFNRPFVFLIVDKQTRIPLFISQVTSATHLEEPQTTNNNNNTKKNK